MPTDQEVRTSLKQVINKATPDARIFPWFILEGPPKHWAGKLANLLQLDALNRAKVHAYLISRSETSGEWKTGNCARRWWSYEIFAFHWYDTGTESGNSDFTFNAELDLITSYLDDLTLVAADLPDAAVILDSRRDPIEWEIHLDPFGDKSLHFAIGRIAIRTQ